MTPFPFVCSLALLAGPAMPPAERAAANSISAAALRAHVRFLASDLLEGRGPATRGDALAQEYIQSELEGLGLKPGAPGGGWRQPFDIIGVQGHPSALRFSPREGSPLVLNYSKDFIAVSGHQRPSSVLQNAEVVFVGYGIVAPEYQWDDYKGMDLKGKVLLMMNSDPESDPALFAGKTRLYYGRWDYKYEIAAKVGAAGAIIIHTTHSAGYPWQVVQTSWADEQFDLPSTEATTVEVRGWTTEDATRRLCALAGQDLDKLRAAAEKRDFRPVPLGVGLTTSFPNAIRKTQTANVLAVLPGSDPALSKQLVVYIAHHDHLGRKPGAKPGEDDIYNGAMDNASGVSALLTLARAYAALPKAPRRTVLFAAVAAEEQGLLGSQYLVEHPPVPPGTMAIDINIDGLNIFGRTRDVTVIGSGKSNLDGMIAQLAAEQGREIKPDQQPDRGFFYRSDQFNFAKQGVPSAYFSSGMNFIGRPDGWGKAQREAWEEKHYHQPSDELRDDWDLSGAVEDVQLYFWLGMRVANADEMPHWNKGDEFEQARIQSLRAPSPR